MFGRKIIFYILGAFIAGTMVLVYVEYISTKHVHALITANKKLLGEFQITQRLLDAAKSKVVIERKLRGFIESRDTSYLSGLAYEFHEISAADSFLLTISDDNATVALIQQLHGAIQRKVNLFHKVLDTYRHYGITAAEDSINANLSEWVSYDIETTIRRITDTRGTQLASITGAIQQSGEKALEFSYALIALVLVAAALVLWYVIYIFQKLTRSEKKVKEAARIKENFLANMSHEIRTPMNSILGFTELLNQKSLDENAKHYVTTIQRSGENLLAIVNDILDISKIEAGMMRIEKASFSLSGLVDSVETMMRPKAVAKGITLLSEIDSTIPDILEGDAIRLTQILSNLLSNAIKFTVQGSILVKILPVELSSQTITLKIDVNDTGIGIEPKKLKHIFGRFQQADETITRQFGGTGLGLSIVKDLVEMQHGTIDVESVPGSGTSFHLVIPYDVAPMQNMDEFILPVHRFKGAVSSSINILVTEDNEFNQSLLSHILNNWQVRFDIAENGLEAIEKLKTNQYDLLLMDIQMPVMDGYTAAQKIRNELKSKIPIIAMTAHALPGEKEKCLSYGMNDYIAKPTKQAELSQLISRYTSFVEPQLKENPLQNQFALKNEPYRYIRLQYLREVSSGHTTYEKNVTEKFLKAIPLAIDGLETSLQDDDVVQLAQIAHNLKTTVSVMGLNHQLDPLLDLLESRNTDSLATAIHQIKEICYGAMAEAQEFHSSLSAS